MQLRKFAELRDWKVSGEYIDTCSGKTPNRPGLKLLKSDAKSRSFDVVLVLRIDRIMRSSKHFYNLADELEECGVRICTCDGIDYSTPIGRLIRGLLLDVAQFEGELVVMRTKEGHERARAAGRIIGRPTVDVDLKELIGLLEAGVGKGAIARLKGYSHATINNRLRAAGREDFVAPPTNRSATTERLLLKKLRQIKNQTNETGGKHYMNSKENYKRLTISLPKEHYNLLMQRKLLHGCPISTSVREALDRGRNSTTRK